MENGTKHRELYTFELSAKLLKYWGIEKSLLVILDRNSNLIGLIVEIYEIFGLI
jgi:hypothetical protein